MDDPVIFLNFANNICNVTVARAKNKILGFIPNFRALMTTSDSQIDEFVKNKHSSNSARWANAKILIPSGTIMRLKSIQFKLEDKRKCNALPNSIQLAAINYQDMVIFHHQRSQALEEELQHSQVSLPDITVPNVDGKNYDNYISQFNEVVTPTYGDHCTSIDYLLREANGAYMLPWTTRTEKLCNCLSLSGPKYTADWKTLYSLFVQYIGTTGHGSNLVIEHKTTQNGYQMYIDVCTHYHNQACLGRQALATNQSLAKLQYKEERRCFNIET